MNPILRNNCSEEWLDFIYFYSKTLVFNENDVIFNCGDEVNGLFIVNSGKIKVVAKTGQNQERIVRLVSKNDVLGHRGFGGSWLYTVTAIALDDSELLFIPLKIFNAAVKSNPDFAYFMMMFFAEELRESEKFASQLPIRNKIASVILNNLQVFGFANDDRKTLNYTLSRKDLASLAGTRYETLIRTLADFAGEGLVELEGKSIKILDLERLTSLKNGEN